MADENIKTVKIPVSEIKSVQQDGSILLRYRVKSKDKNKNSHPSRIYKVSPGKSFSELSGYAIPLLTDNHPSSAVVYTNASSSYMESELTRGGRAGSNTYTYSWTPANNFGTTQEFDIYLSWKTDTAWEDWEFAGTTSANSFSFQRPANNTTYQFVQAAVTVSAFPKLTNIGNDDGVNILLSLSKILYIYYSAAGTVTNVAGPTNGFFTATITGLTTNYQSPTATNNFIGLPITAKAGTGNFGTGLVTVTGRAAGQITVKSDTTLNAGTVTDIQV